MVNHLGLIACSNELWGLFFLRKNLAGETGAFFFCREKVSSFLRFFFLMKTVEVILPPPT
jgi:hypothetical protein